MSWKFHRRQGACSVCDRPFEDGEVHYSRLFVRAGELERGDACWRCWTAEQAARAEGHELEPAARELEVFWWRTRHSAHKQRGLALNLPALEALFLSLEGRGETRLRELRYLLCLILMRKRRLKLVRIRREKEGEAFEVRRPRRQESLKVWVFDFTPERMDELRAELRELFENAEAEREGAPPAEPGAEADSAQDDLDGGGPAGPADTELEAEDPVARVG